MIKICFVTTIFETFDCFLKKLSIYLLNTGLFDLSLICDGESLAGKTVPPGVHFYPVQMKRGAHLSGIKSCVEIRKIFRREKYDLIQYSTPNAALYAAIAGKLEKIPVRLYCQWGLAYVGMKGVKRKIFKTIEKAVCSLSTWIEPDSKSNLEFAHSEKLYPINKGSVIWNGSACGIDLGKFDISKKAEKRKHIRELFLIPDAAFVFIFIGRINKDKGINELLSAFKRINNENAKVFLLMVGNCEAVDQLEQANYIWSKNCDRIFYAGRVDNVEDYLSASDCYILPSYREGFGMGVIEAESMGVPVIVTDIPGPRDAMIDKQTGIAVKVRDSNRLYEAMKEILRDNKRYGENGYIFATEKFDQTKLFQMILDDRKKLLGLL